jgi:ATP-dependent DNA helicase RecQ
MVECIPMTDLTDALHEHFGFPAFRPGQEEAVRAAADGRDVLVVMPTGAGKSLCYQLPALLRDDLSIVVSPLVSLMADQVNALTKRAPGAVALVNAQQDAEANREVLARARAGDLRVLYVAPERFSSPGFLEALRETPIGLFVVDEAHCVSQWGHDFRPDYFRLADAARWLGAAAIVASTATATPQVAADIAQRLKLADPVRVSTGFDRPNLSFCVVPCGAAADKHRRIAAALEDPAARPAIVYAGTRRGADALADSLSAALGIEVPAYHAGLSRDDRAEAQRRFMDGEVQVVVATNAFGMGVDKADVRTVAHESVPSSLEAYYQEAGRAGRDGQPARALLFAAQRDKGLHVFFIERGEVGDDRIAQVARRLLGDAVDGRYDLALHDVAPDPDDADRVRAVIGHLAQAGVIAPSPAPVDRLRGRVLAPFDGRARAACRVLAAEGTRARWRQYRAIWAYVEGDRCRRETILRHFGDPSPPRADVPCCDVCAPETVSALTAAAGSRMRVAPGDGPVPTDLDEAILGVVTTARPALGRNKVVEVLRGGRSKVVLRNSWDGLPGYGAFDYLRAQDVLDRVDALLADGRLHSTGGAYPTLKAEAV